MTSETVYPLDSIMRTDLSCRDSPDKVLTLALDSRWWFAVNGNKGTRTVKALEWGDIEIPAYTAAVFYNGWPAGMFDPYAGVFAAGSCANAVSFDQAVTDWLARQL